MEREDLLRKLEVLGLLDKVKNLVQEAEEEEEEKKVRGKLTSVISQALTDLGITDGDGVLKNWPFPGKSLVIRLFDNGDSGVAIEVKRVKAGGERREGGRGRKGGCRVEKDGEIYIGPTFAAIARYLNVDFSGKSASNALKAKGWTCTEVEGEVYEEVQKLS
mgnify:CR=1 FL=1